MKQLAIIGLGITLLGTSCVSKKKFIDAENTISSLRGTNKELRDDIQNLKDRLQLMEEANNNAALTIGEKEALLNQTSAALQDKDAKLKDQAARLQELQNILDQQKRKTEALHAQMAKALGNFNSDQLSVIQKNGKVYVSMSEKLLFPSGSAVVNKDGQEALRQIAQALNENTDININVEGHTDSIPIKGRFEDNWALSVARSTAVIRLLSNQYGVAPERITSSGRSQFEPIDDNSTVEGRARNRRTEIILAPKLDLLMELIESNK